MSARTNTVDDLWKKIKIGNKSECWEWTGSFNTGGYGQFGFMGKNMLAHRIAFFSKKGFLPIHVCHSCDNKRCCNPSHLFAGNPKTNMEDKMKKGRGVFLRGEAQPSSVLLEKDISSIRKMLKSGKTMKYVASVFGVSPSTISDIKRGATWKHVV